MKTILLNLPERKDRLENAKRQLGAYGISFEVFPAFKGAKYSGTNKSFIEILKKYKDDDIFYIEDDVIICEDFDLRYKELRIPKEWDLIYLGGQTRVKNDEIFGEPVMPNLYRTYATLMAEMLLINKNCIQSCIKVVEDNPDEPHDVSLFKIQERGHSYCVLPRLAWQSGGWSNNVDKKTLPSTQYYIMSEDLTEIS